MAKLEAVDFSFGCLFSVVLFECLVRYLSSISSNKLEKTKKRIHIELTFTHISQNLEKHSYFVSMVLNYTYLLLLWITQTACFCQLEFYLTSFLMCLPMLCCNNLYNYEWTKNICSVQYAYASRNFVLSKFSTPVPVNMFVNGNS